jgi:hypothetical protein
VDALLVAFEHGFVTRRRRRPKERHDPLEGDPGTCHHHRCARPIRGACRLGRERRRQLSRCTGQQNPWRLSSHRPGWAWQRSRRPGWRLPGRELVPSAATLCSKTKPTRSHMKQGRLGRPSSWCRPWPAMAIRQVPPDLGERIVFRAIPEDDGVAARQSPRAPEQRKRRCRSATNPHPCTPAWRSPKICDVSIILTTSTPRIRKGEHAARLGSSPPPFARSHRADLRRWRCLLKGLARRSPSRRAATP